MSLLLIDGSAYLHRAFAKLGNLETVQNQPTGALFGLVHTLDKLLKDQQYTHIAVIFDGPGPTFRHEQFADYKAQRPPMPEALKQQLAPLPELVTAMGLTYLKSSGVEADDVIATLARQGENAQMSVFIASPDKDLAQLVNGNIRLIRDEGVMDRDGVFQKYGVWPEQIVDYLTLIGDTSDNLPGVSGVGPKTAAKWLSDFKDLDGIKAAAPDIKGKVGEKLRAALETLPAFQTLITLRCDVPDLPSLEALIRRPADVATLVTLYKRFEFNQLLKGLPTEGDLFAQPTPRQAPQVPRTYQTILTTEALDNLLIELQKAPLIAFDVETNGLDAMSSTLVGIAVAWGPGQAAYIPLAHQTPPNQLALADVLNRLKPLMIGTPKIVGQHLKFDGHILENHGYPLTAVAHDTLLQSYLIDSSGKHDLDYLARQYLQETTIKFSEVAGKGAKQVSFDQVDIDSATAYAAEDADITLRLHAYFWPRLENTPKVKKIYENMELPLMPILRKMERHGILVDTEQLKRQSEVLAQQLAELERQAAEEAGMPFNLNSPKQLQEILFEKMGLPVRVKTPKGVPSTAEEALSELTEFPLPRLILAHRSLNKLKTTYTDRLPEQCHPETGRIHTSFQQTGTITGRLSSSDPNLQNIPIRTEDGRRIRQAFIAPPNFCLVTADYSQIELRILAHLSEDSGLLNAFSRGADIHSATAADLFGVTEVSAEQRRFAKTINFGLIYGMSAFGLAKKLGIDQRSAAKFVTRYFEQFPQVKAFMEKIKKDTTQRGFVETLYGRRIYLPDLQAKSGVRRQGAERTAINAPMQGTAADLIKLAMIRIDQWLIESRFPAKMLLQVHDELVFEVETASAHALIEQLKVLMTQVAELRVPLEVTTGMGQNWDAAHG